MLGITRVDPIEHNLLFERFLHEEMTSTPDIDIDFSTEHREQVIQYVYNKYGAERTGMVCNVVTFQPRMFTQLWRSVDKRGQAETRRLLLLHNGFGEKSADVLFKAFKEVANRDDKTVRSLEPEEVATFHRVENAWKDIVTQIT